MTDWIDDAIIRSQQRDKQKTKRQREIKKLPQRKDSGDSVENLIETHQYEVTGAAFPARKT